jgi:Histidine kinase-like ATPase domain
MTTRLALPQSVRARGDGGYAVVRCLSGPRPEHRARRLVTDVLAAAGVEAGLGDVELAVNELVTNARQHAPGPYELRIIFGPTSVMVAVVDGGADHAELARRFLNAAAGGVADGESGRGLQIVAGLFPGSCGTGPTSTCTGLTPAKQVWITIGCRMRTGQGRGVAGDRVGCTLWNQGTGGAARDVTGRGGLRAAGSDAGV